MYRNLLFSLKCRHFIFFSKFSISSKKEILCRKGNRNENFSTWKFHGSMEAVDLSYSLLQPDGKVSSSVPVIILHGLLGSKQNWRGLGNAIAKKSKRKVYLLDARNHGESPHTDDINYYLMSEDVKCFMHSHGIPEAVIIGHSMGGRTAMYLAVTNENIVNQLIIVDVCPNYRPNQSSMIPDYLKAMKEAISSVSKLSPSEARKSLKEYLFKTIPEVGVCQFLLTNLVEDNNVVKWKPNLDVLYNKFESELMKFPAVSGYYSKETTFICGGDSPYIKPSDYPDILKIFPKADFITIPGAGHWVHSDKPVEFLNAVYDIL